jgi:clan AA aspartic protease (TIGR02281 family)
MGAFANIVGVGCFIGVVGFGLSFGGLHPHTAGGPPVLPADVLPPSPPDFPQPHTMTVAAGVYGQFWISGSANGVAMTFLADTGASDITFNKSDARRLGIDVSRLHFDGQASTANGVARTASARIDRLSVGPFTFTDTPVSIIEGDLAFPLLGMALLQRMNISISSGMLTLSSEP